MSVIAATTLAVACLVHGARPTTEACATRVEIVAEKAR
jgi:hypothetical protein